MTPPQSWIGLSHKKDSQNETNNAFSEEINQIALRSNVDKIIQSVDLIKTYAYGTKKDLIHQTEEIKATKKRLTLMILQKKLLHPYRITIHTEY